MLSFLSIFFETFSIDSINLSSALDNLSESLSSTFSIFWLGFLALATFSKTDWYLPWALAISVAYFSKALSNCLSVFWVNFILWLSIFSASLSALSEALSAFSTAFSAALVAFSAALVAFSVG